MKCFGTMPMLLTKNLEVCHAMLFFHSLFCVETVAYTNRKGMSLLSAGIPLAGCERHVQTLVQRGYIVTM